MGTVSRVRELGVVRAALDLLPSGGRGLLFTGEAGVGKSHLLAELEAEANTRTFTFVRGRCFSDGGTAFGAFPAAIDLGRALPSLGAADDRARAFASALASLDAMARRRPVVLAIDDLHWADDDSLQLFVHIARFGLDAPVLLVGTVRQPGDASAGLERLLAELAREPRFERLALRPFVPGEAAMFAAELAGAELPSALMDHLFRESGGNPLYVRELVRHLVEEGKLALREGRLASDFALSALGLPANVRDVVRHRVARLSEAAIALVRVAAVAETPQPLVLLAGVAELSTPRALDAIDEAIASGILRASGDGYELSHPIVRRAVEGELNPDRRATLHRGVAERLSATSGVPADEVARHWHASKTLPGAEAGVPFALQAADEAAHAGSPSAATAFLAIARELAQDPATARDVAIRLALAHAAAFDVEATLAALDDFERRWRDDERFTALLVDVARILEGGGVPRATWRPLVAKGLARVTKRDATWARLVLLDRAIEPVVQSGAFVSRLGPCDPEAITLLRAGSERDYAATVDGHDVRALEETHALLARVEGWTDPLAVLRVMDACARDVFFRGHDHRACVALLERILARSQQVGAITARVAALVVLGCSLAPLGALDEARNSLAQARTLSTRLGDMHRMRMVGPLALDTVLAYFERRTCKETADQLVAVATSPRTGQTPFGLPALGLGMLGTMLSGDEDRAFALMPFQLEALEQLPAELNEWGGGIDCAAATMALATRTIPPELPRRYLALLERGEGTMGSACWSVPELAAARLQAALGDDASALFVRARARLEANGCHAAAACADDDRRERNVEPTPDGLTTREMEILRLVATGLANKEIATKLFVSVPTVERHVANVYRKIGVKSRAAATAYALKKGLA